MKFRVASLFLSVTFVAASAFAQGKPPSPPPSTTQLASDLAALAARVAKLEGNIVAADLAGTYLFIVYDTGMSGSNVNTGQMSSITTSTVRLNLTLNADGTGHFSPVALVPGTTECEGATLILGTGAMQAAECDHTDSGDVTWTYADGVVTITTNDGDHLPFSVALGGRFLIVAASPLFAQARASEHTLFIASRLK
jgi:hypothetical protein